MSINKNNVKNVFVGILTATEFAAGATLATLMALGTLQTPAFLSQKPAQMLFQMAVATLLVATLTLALYNATRRVDTSQVPTDPELKEQPSQDNFSTAKEQPRPQLASYNATRRVDTSQVTPVPEFEGTTITR